MKIQKLSRNFKQRLRPNSTNWQTWK